MNKELHKQVIKALQANNKQHIQVVFLDEEHDICVVSGTFLRETEFQLVLTRLDGTKVHIDKESVREVSLKEVTK